MGSATPVRNLPVAMLFISFAVLLSVASAVRSNNDNNNNSNNNSNNNENTPVFRSDVSQEEIAFARANYGNVSVLQSASGRRYITYSGPANGLAPADRRNPSNN